MGDVNFDDTFNLKANPFVAAGSIESQYKTVNMYVGIVQLERPGSDEITGGAFGIGAAATNSNGDGTDRWTMVLQHDSQDKRKLYNGEAIGFVVAELPGGKFTGWVDHNVLLYGGEDRPGPPTPQEVAKFVSAIKSGDVVISGNGG
jgi:hypothetical protein